MSSRGLRRRSATCSEMYECSQIIADTETSFTMPTPGSRWKIVSICSRTSGRSASGTPSSIEMTLDGTSAPKSAT